MFGIGEKHTTSNTTNQTTNNYTDQSANAGGDGSIAVSNGATLNIQDLSEGVAKAAIDAGVKQTEFTTNTIRGISETAARDAEQARNSADLSIKTTQGLFSKLQEDTSKALERAQIPEAASVSKLLLPVIGALLVGFALWVFRKNK